MLPGGLFDTPINGRVEGGVDGRKVDAAHVQSLYMNESNETLIGHAYWRWVGCPSTSTSSASFSIDYVIYIYPHVILLSSCVSSVTIQIPRHRRIKLLETNI